MTAASNIDYTVRYTRRTQDPVGTQVILSTNGGAAAGDCDGDGDIDLFITYGDTDGNGPGGPNRLYLNQLDQGNGLSFMDNAVVAGVANARSDGQGNDRYSGPTFADIDGDGDLDLFIGGLFYDSNKVFANQGDCTFVDVTPPELKSAGEGGTYLSDKTISAGFGDYDLDGDLDLFLTHWGTFDSIFDDGSGNPNETEHLWRNDSPTGGPISFTNVSMASGVTDIRWADRAFDTSGRDADWGFSPSFARLDGDLWPDILLASDFGTTQALINDGDFTFTAVNDPVLRDAQWGMGSALGDFDDDGDLDWFVTSIFGTSNDPMQLPHGNRLYRNDFDQALEFTDVSMALGVDNGSWGWGTCFLDIDNDADLDIYHTNGWPEEFLGQGYLLDRSRTFINNGAGSYSNRAPVLGLDDDRDGRGVVCADFDNDGDTDILELTFDAAHGAILWENRTAAAGNNFLRVRLEGLAPNTEAAGARIFATINGETQMREIVIGSNFTSQNPTVQIFGLGAATQVDTLVVEWPAISPGPGMTPVQPTEWQDTNVDASNPGETLVIRHPDLP